jgi:hypothetical protein
MIHRGSDYLRLAILGGTLPRAVSVDRHSLPWDVLSLCSVCREALGQLLAGRPMNAEATGPAPSTPAIVAEDLGQHGPVKPARPDRPATPGRVPNRGRPAIVPAADPPRVKPPRWVARLSAHWSG